MKTIIQKKIGYALLFLLVISSVVTAQGKRTLSFDIGYRTDTYSNRAIGDFGLEYVQATSLIFEGGASLGILKKSPFLRGAWLALDIVINDFLSQPISQSYHEFGHGTRMAAYGVKPEFHIGIAYSDHPYDTFFSFFINDFGNTKGASAWAADGNNLNDLSEYQYAVEKAGGVNNEMYISELIRNNIYLHGGRVPYWSYHWRSKLSSHFYAVDERESLGGFGDLGQIVDYYENRGIDINLDDIDKASQYTLYFSSTTYAMLYGFWNYIVHGKTSMNNFERKGFNLPDVFFYLNPEGLSYKLTSGFRLNENWCFPFAYEWVFKGKSKRELSLDVHRKFPFGYVQIGILAGEGFGFHGMFNYHFLDMLSASVGLTHYDTHTLFGTRNIPGLNVSGTKNEFWIKLSLLY